MPTDPHSASINFMYQRLLAQSRFNTEVEENLRQAQLQAQVGGLGWVVWPAAILDRAQQYYSNKVPTGAHATSDTAYFRIRESSKLKTSWKCAYCGGIRASDTLTCQGCGAARSPQ